MTTLADFRAAFPAFNSRDDNEINYALSEGDAETGGRRWGSGDFKTRGMFMYAAHYLSVSSSAASRGVLTAKSVGDESASYDVGVIGDAWLSSSSYGQQFIRLRRRAGRGALVV